MEFRLFVVVFVLSSVIDFLMSRTMVQSLASGLFIVT